MRKWTSRHVFPYGVLELGPRHVQLEHVSIQECSQYLHCTSIFALALTVGVNPFSAVHQYFPERVLLVSKLSLSPLATVFPSFVHVMFGLGLPVASQTSVTVAPSTTVLLDGLVVKVGETGKKANVVSSKREITVHAIPLPSPLPKTVRHSKGIINFPNVQRNFY